MFVVVVVTTGASTVEGALQAGFGFVILQQLLTYVPARLGGNSLVVVFFAFGALTYAAHPEGILEFQKRRWTLRFERMIFHTDPCRRPGRVPGRAAGGMAGGRRAGGGRPWLSRHRSAAPGDRGDQGLRGDPGRQRRHHGGRRRARASAWSGPTAPARPPCSTASAASCAPSGGRSSWTARDLLGLPTYQRARLGVGRTYQRIEVFPDMTVRDHLVVALAGPVAERVGCGGTCAT